MPPRRSNRAAESAVQQEAIATPTPKPRRKVPAALKGRQVLEQEGRNGGSVDGQHEEEEGSDEGEASSIPPPAKKRRVAAGAVAGSSSSSNARRASSSNAAAKKDKARDDARHAHIGQHYEPGNGQLGYTLTAPEPTRDANGDFHFKDQPTFTPNLSPEEIIRQGSFGGGFFRPYLSKKSGKELHDDWEDLPKEWYAGLDVSSHLTRPEGTETEVNKWGAKVGQSYEEWEKNGWIVAEHDCRGWFQWYCRFFRGRRLEDEDARQIGRWERIASEKSGRWRRIYYGKYFKNRIHEIEPDSETISRGIRQTLNHWAYEPRTAHLDYYRQEKGDSVANEEADF